MNAIQARPVDMARELQRAERVATLCEQAARDFAAAGMAADAAANLAFAETWRGRAAELQTRMAGG